MTTTTDLKKGQHVQPPNLQPPSLQPPYLQPMVSIIVPCRNEAKYIGRCMESIVANDYPKEKLEIIVVDGVSDDGTVQVLTEFGNRYPFIKLLSNPQRTTPHALNIGIGAAQGEIIMRMDVHVLYPGNYISGLIAWLLKSGADNVGSVMTTRPASDTPIAEAIAIGLSHPVGVGNSHFRIGSSEPKWVDTVPFGCYRKEVFEKIGLFDEELVRNQDDEFNLRLIKHGGKILLVPDIVCDYFGRESLGRLWRMYYQYGYFKPLVIQKIGGVLTVRQIVPAAFVLAVMSSALLSILLPWLFLPLLLFVLVSYGLVVSGCAAIVGLRRGWPVALRMPAVFAALHVSYGVGFIRGIYDFMLRKGRRRSASELGLSR